MKIEPHVLNELAELVVAGSTVTITRQLDRMLYVKVDKVLQACGGRWSRADRKHVFAINDPAMLLEKVMATGEVTTDADLGFFPTPPDLVRRMLDLAEVGAGTVMLEPSAGDGAIAMPAYHRGADVDCFEIDVGRSKRICERLHGAAVAGREDGAGLWNVTTADFLTVSPEPVYDAVVMNPPFAKQQDIDHVRHALAFLRPGGRLVAVMSAGTLFRTNKKAVDFRKLIEDGGGVIEDLPENTFKASGTNVNTVLVCIG